MMTEKDVFIEHVVTTVEKQLEEDNDVMIEVQFNQKTFDGIHMYLSEIIAEARTRNLSIDEDSKPNTLLVIQI